jgi:hypothetical protein
LYFFNFRPIFSGVFFIMSAIKITKEIYRCKCEAKGKNGIPCPNEWDADNIPLRCPKCKSRKWNRGYRLSRKEPLTYNGRTQSIAAWSRELGLAKSTIPWRIKEGWPMEQVLSKEDWRLQQ